jgi:outer membrane protein
MLALRNLLSLRPEQLLAIVAPDHNEIRNMTVLPDLYTVVELALGSLPELRISQQNITLAENSVKLAQTAYYPNLSLNAGIGSGYASGSGNYGNQLSNRFNQSVTLNLNIPLYSKGKTKSNVQQSKIRVEQAILRHDQAELDVVQQVETEYQNIVAILNKFNAAEIKYNATAASYRAYEKQFDAGSITVTDLLLQKNNHINAFTDVVQSKYSYILERKILDIYMGQ